MRIKDPVWQSCGQIKKIVRLLKGKIRFVGGCVRDSLIGKMPGDIDMATTLKPPAVMGILKKHGFTVLPTGFIWYRYRIDAKRIVSGRRNNDFTPRYFQ